MRKALIILTPAFPKDEGDSTWLPDRQIFVRTLKKAHPDLNIIVLTFQYPLESAEYMWNGIKVIALGGKNKSGFYRRLMWLRAWRALKKTRATYDIIGLLSFWMDECAFIADKFAKKFSIKHYCWLLGQDARPGNKYVYRIMPDGDNLVALSDFLVGEFNRNYGVIPKHLAPGAINPSLFKTYTGERDIDVIAVGSLIKLKQYSVYIDVIQALKCNIPQINVILCGTGPEMAPLKAKINRLGLKDNITLTGELPHADVLALMQRAKVFLHTSKYEGFGIVCLEALYAGAKVISFVQSMNSKIPNWHIAGDVTDMTLIAKDVLLDKDLLYYPVLPYDIADTAKIIMELYTQQEAAIAPIRPAMASNERVDLK
ncbi:MAG: glycosyltransferase family 4 protein [Mucilaginibacter sp.]|nr:glycosyltransferase family 4 protein [Mucilaginibacter sp.]